MLEDGWQGRGVEYCRDEAGRYMGLGCGLCYYGADLRIMLGYTGPLLYWGVRLYWAAIRGHSVEELLQPAPFNKPRSWEKESASG